MEQKLHALFCCPFYKRKDDHTVWRGVTEYNANQVKALSWTLDRDKAEWFAHRFNQNGTVYKAQIDKEHILALFTGRNEAEVIVDPKYLTDIMIDSAIETEVSPQIVCTDSCECFDENKAYLESRIAEEQNPKVRSLLKKDVDVLGRMQTELATARQFLFVLRCRNMKPEQVLQAANRAEKTISEQGFEVQRMSKSAIKRFLAIYFNASLNGEQMPDIDGEQFFEL